MPSTDLLKEAERQLTVCNACRYCEGYCAVFPAMESRRIFNPADLVYLANLCFECRACYYACQFAPPHEYGINIPEVLSAVRVETYRDYTWPSLLSRWVHGRRLGVPALASVMLALVLAAVIAFQGPSLVFSDSGGSFFAVVPYWWMVVPALALSLFSAAALAVGGVRFWRSSDAGWARKLDLASFIKASKDAFGLTYLKGGGAGCTYPEAQTSHSRRMFHHLVFYGFLLDFASTTVAAIYLNLLDRESPYALLSLPVVLGTVGGVMIVVGVVGLLYLKARADTAPAHARMIELDVAFLGLLLFVSLSGLILLALRDSVAMGTLLLVHLGIVAGLFATMPFGKFAHVVYRYLALMRYQNEEASNK